MNEYPKRDAFYAHALTRLQFKSIAALGKMLYSSSFILRTRKMQRDIRGNPSVFYDPWHSGSVKMKGTDAHGVYNHGSATTGGLISGGSPSAIYSYGSGAHGITDNSVGNGWTSKAAATQLNAGRADVSSGRVNIYGTNTIDGERSAVVAALTSVSQAMKEVPGLQIALKPEGTSTVVVQVLKQLFRGGISSGGRPLTPAISSGNIPSDATASPNQPSSAFQPNSKGSSQ